MDEVVGVFVGVMLLGVVGIVEEDVDVKVIG